MQTRNDPVYGDYFIAKCKEHNLKITPQRTAIYNQLSRAKNHPSADIIFQKVKKLFPNISLDTVNRTLITFSEIGIVDVVEGHGNPRRFDPDKTSHHHFYCIRCGGITDIYNKEYDNLKTVEEIEQGFIVLSKRVVLNGICDKCVGK
jgi:Fur family transcriptional regulator, peroxide stress response regulator